MDRFRFSGLPSQPDSEKAGPFDSESTDKGEPGPSINEKLGLSRRNVLAGTAAALALELTGNRSHKPSEEYVKGKEGKLIKFPEFILEKPKGKEAELVPDNITEIIDDAWNFLDEQEAGYVVKSIPVPKPREAKKIERSKKGRQNKKPKVVNIERLESNALLATFDLKHKENGLHSIRIDPEGFPDDEEHEVQTGANLGIGTGYDVVLPEHEVVLAVKKALKLDGEYIEVTYTPYNPELDTPTLRKAGYEYLINLIREAQAELNKKNVNSLVEPGKPIGQVVPEDLLIKLVIAEQADPFIFKRKSAELARELKISIQESDVLVMKNMANQALTTVGANREYARKYSKSKPGARGLFQLMPDTYKALQEGVLDRNAKNGRRNLYPKANLDPNFISGASEHLNAAEAVLMLSDSNWHGAPKGERDKFKSPGGERNLGMYLSACFNTGSGNVNHAIRVNGDSWPNHVGTEAGDYVRKFLAIDAVFKGKIPEIETLPGQYKEAIELTPRNPNSVKRFKDIPYALRGPGSDSMGKQHKRARAEGLIYIQNPEDIEPLTKGKNPYLVPLPEAKNLKIDPSIPQWRRFCRPETASALLELAAASHKENPNFEPIFVTSAVRDEKTQAGLRTGGNKNASTNSPHPTGAVVDVSYNEVNHIEYKKDSAGKIVTVKRGKKQVPVIESVTKLYGGMTSREQLEWTEKYMIEQEKKGRLEATEETEQPCFHFMAFKGK